MFASHADQENAINARQAQAAAKPLNGFKTPGPANKAPKTPFKLPLNDENTTRFGGKSVLKTNGKLGESKGAPMGNKGVEVDNSAFVTPAGPRARAPLGMKTTNAKARAFETPAPPTAVPGSEKTAAKSSNRLRRARVKVHQGTPVKDVTGIEEREIEYMPPRGTPLPDDPEDWPADKTYPQFEGANYARGTWSTYFNPVGDDGVPRMMKQLEANDAKVAKQQEEQLHKSLEDALGPFTDAEREALGMPPNPKPAPRTKPTTAQSTIRSARPASAAAITPAQKPAMGSSKVSTLSSRRAASALSSYSAPSASMRARANTSKAQAPAEAISASLARKKQPSTLTPAPSTARHQVGAAASRTTLSYAKGRATSSALRKPLAGVHQRTTSQPPPTSASRARRPPTSTAAMNIPGARRSARADSDATLVPHMTKDPTGEPQLEEDDEDKAMQELLMRSMNSFGDELDYLGSTGAGMGDDDEEDEFHFDVPELQDSTGE